MPEEPEQPPVPEEESFEDPREIPRISEKARDRFYPRSVDIVEGLDQTVTVL